MEFISKHDFDYVLPEDKIAKYPLKKRSDSKLLVYRNKTIEDLAFNDLPNQLDAADLLVFNDAKVIPARLYFKRATGALIEILLLEPVVPSSYDEAFNAKNECSWKCMVGNGKKWKDSETINFENTAVELTAKWHSKDERIITFNWNREQAFTLLLDEIGELPLPPYLNRKTEEVDRQTYQTVFAKNSGSIAAPTAGLHFTDEIVEQLQQKGVEKCGLTLHVGAGTFLPVKTENALDHEMHREHFEVTLAALKRLAGNTSRVAVGTTSLRVLESLYWLGIQFKNKAFAGGVCKLEPYEAEANMSYETSLNTIINYMEENNLTVLHAWTEIMILPSYRPKSIKALITNFHLPESTLLFVVSSVVGLRWKNIYSHALENDYRFLSYGDSSILFMR